MKQLKNIGYSLIFIGVVVIIIVSGIIMSIVGGLYLLFSPEKLRIIN